MGCGGCGGVGYDPHAAYRNNRGKKFMGKGSSQGVSKSPKPQTVKVKKVKKEEAVELPVDLPESGIIKSAKRLAREAKKTKKNDSE